MRQLLLYFLVDTWMMNLDLNICRNILALIFGVLLGGARLRAGYGPRYSTYVPQGNLELLHPVGHRNSTRISVLWQDTGGFPPAISLKISLCCRQIIKG